MIKAHIYRDTEGFGFELEGHSCHAPYGQDLVCAAVSSLAFALHSYLEREGLLTDGTVLENGRAKISAQTNTASAERLMGAFELAECFLALLQENYPENIGLTAETGRKGRKNNDKQA